MSKIIPPKMLQMCFEHRSTGEIEVIEQKLISTTRELIDWTRDVSKRHKLHLDGSVGWMLREAPDIKTAVKTLLETLRCTPEMYKIYRDSIAAEFVNVCERGGYELHDIATKFHDSDILKDRAKEAAENFLDRWISQDIFWTKT